MTDCVLSANNLNKAYQQGDESLHVLNDLSLQVGQAERLAIVGSSGSGKSTLLNLLGGLDLPDSGEVSLLGQSFSNLNPTQRGLLRNQHLGFVYQFHHLLPEFSALENVLMPLMIAKKNKQAANDIANNLLEQVGLSHRVKHKPSELSGGERQRVAIARSLACEPSCVLMDEPTGNLDEANAEAVHDLMLQLNETHKTSFVLVTHDLNLAKRMDRVLELTNGQLVPFHGS